ncbi:hypothetical protein ACFQ8W_29275 [Streptomyces sp. NPDC056508]|uniref:hypothetical protein n=1 Tax=Streptomyces sp. NPDC056508 TaxID=3345845 RepID=UPI0036C525F0
MFRYVKAPGQHPPPHAHGGFAAAVRRVRKAARGGAVQAALEAGDKRADEFDVVEFLSLDEQAQECLVAVEQAGEVHDEARSVRGRVEEVVLQAVGGGGVGPTVQRQDMSTGMGGVDDAQVTG